MSIGVSESQESTIHIGSATFNLPYRNLVPDLSPEEFEALKADIGKRGQLVPIMVDDKLTVIDGHHRLMAIYSLREHEGIKIDPRILIQPGLEESEKEELAVKLNSKRRHLTREQKQEWAAALRGKGWSYPRIAGALGVDQQTVLNWAPERSAFENSKPEQVSGSDGKAYPADQLSDDEIQERRRKVWGLHEEGLSQRAIAKQLDCSIGTVNSDLRAGSYVSAGAADSEATKALLDKVEKLPKGANTRKDAQREASRGAKKEKIEDRAQAFQARGDLTIHHGRLEETELGTEVFDLVITDPPYDVADADIDRPSHTSDLKRNYGDWDKQASYPIEAWAKKIADSMSQGASLYLFISDNLMERWKLALIAAGLEWRQVLVWHKTNPAPQIRQTKWCSAQEFILHLSKGRPKYFNWLGQNEMHSVLTGPIAQGNERLGHATEKPAWILEKLVSVSGQAGMKMLDPFAGSGTSGGAAIKAGLHATLIEPESAHITLIKARFSHVA